MQPCRHILQEAGITVGTSPRRRTEVGAPSIAVSTARARSRNLRRPCLRSAGSPARPSRATTRFLADRLPAQIDHAHVPRAEVIRHLLKIRRHDAPIPASAKRQIRELIIKPSHHQPHRRFLTQSPPVCVQINPDFVEFRALVHLFGGVGAHLLLQRFAPANQSILQVRDLSTHREELVFLFLAGAWGIGPIM